MSNSGSGSDGSNEKFATAKGGSRGGLPAAELELRFDADRVFW